MSYFYEFGTVRWFRWPLNGGDVRGHRPPKGWTATAVQLDHHPTTGELFKNAPQWWMRETCIGKD